MNSAAAGCGIMVLRAVTILVWLILLISSILFRPKAGTGTIRLVDRMLLVASVVMILAIGASHSAAMKAFQDHVESRSR